MAPRKSMDARREAAAAVAQQQQARVTAAAEAARRREEAAAAASRRQEEAATLAATRQREEATAEADRRQAEAAALAARQREEAAAGQRQPVQVADGPNEDQSVADLLRLVLIKMDQPLQQAALPAVAPVTWSAPAASAHAVLSAPAPPVPAPWAATAPGTHAPAVPSAWDSVAWTVPAAASATWDATAWPAQSAAAPAVWADHAAWMSPTTTTTTVALTVAPLPWPLPWQLPWQLPCSCRSRRPSKKGAGKNRTQNARATKGKRKRIVYNDHDEHYGDSHQEPDMEPQDFDKLVEEHLERLQVDQRDRLGVEKRTREQTARNSCCRGNRVKLKREFDVPVSLKARLCSTADRHRCCGDDAVILEGVYYKTRPSQSHVCGSVPCDSCARGGGSDGLAPAAGRSGRDFGSDRHREKIESEQRERRCLTGICFEFVSFIGSNKVFLSV
ncbi:unnamed protein product [Trichogramma brassicae]|uniref:Uncharacterized protein n=1 Tax=Trichogramma brassicae TaxID=86971 RepID=A0A6H5JBV4_9HYME|nr:unnamed protein product [Trichogramma brassicae]